jgi:hypothetical protein
LLRLSHGQRPALLGMQLESLKTTVQAYHSSHQPLCVCFFGVYNYVYVYAKL